MTQLHWPRLLSIGLGLWLLGCAPSPTVQAPPTQAPQTQAPQTQAPQTQAPQTQAPQAEAGQMLPISAEVEIAGQVIQLEVAQTPQQQEMGLMHRTDLAADRGMLFPFDPPRPVMFWMKNVQIPLDMVFLRDGEVKAIAANAPPCTANPCPTYGSRTAINQVIELRGGRAAELGLQVGDRVEVRFLDAAP